jgi:hypothetical protein
VSSADDDPPIGDPRRARAFVRTSPGEDAGSVLKPRVDEIADVQTRFEAESGQAITSLGAATEWRPDAARKPPTGPSGAQTALLLANRIRVAAACAGLIAVIGFFATAYHDALDGNGGDRFAGADTSKTTASKIMDHTLSIAVTSKPSGATVSARGDDRGTTPTAFNVACAEGSHVTVIVSAPGYAPSSTDVPCKNGGVSDVDVTLNRSTGR